MPGFARGTIARRCYTAPGSRRGGALFPHLYGDLPLDAVLAVEPLPLGPDGQHVFPNGVAGTVGA